MSNSQLVDGTDDEEVVLVIRSVVEDGKPYNSYKQHLRYDFFYLCAYCTISEAEAAGVRFTIDHYDAKSVRADLENRYSNLMWACDHCNVRKGSRYPSVASRAMGHRFFRPDEDRFCDHFKLEGQRLSAASNTGEYTIETLDLNRQTLRQLRSIRNRLQDAHDGIANQMERLTNLHIDRLPAPLRGIARDVTKKLSGAVKAAEIDINESLRGHFSSHLLDETPINVVETADRKKRIQQIEALYPDKVWKTRKSP